MTKFTNVTIRIAGIAQRIKNGYDGPHWRFRINDEPTDYLINSWHFQGSATKQNISQGTNPQASDDELFAWVEVRNCDIETDDHLNATITLRA